MWWTPAATSTTTWTTWNIAHDIDFDIGDIAMSSKGSVWARSPVAQVPGGPKTATTWRHDDMGTCLVHVAGDVCPPSVVPRLPPPTTSTTTWTTWNHIVVDVKAPTNIDNDMGDMEPHRGSPPPVVQRFRGHRNQWVS